jgi:outer membrane protein TolC
MKKALIWIIGLCCFHTASAQKTLELKTFLGWVKLHHPVAKQSEITVANGKAALLLARSGFDPRLEGDFSNKTFDGKSYYNHEVYGLRVPTWLGVEVLAQYERGQGAFLNPESNTPADGLYRAGLSLPVGQGLFFDKRRSELRKAQLYRDAAYLEQQTMLNDLLLDAASQYAYWQLSYQEQQVYQEAVNISREIMNAVRMSYQLGDRAAVDTLEARIQLGNWEQRLREAEIKFQENSFKLSIFLWDENGRPLEISPETIPDTSIQSLRFPPLQSPDDVVLQHPEFQLYDFKLRQLNFDRRLAIESIKPKVDLKFYALNQTTRPELIPLQGEQLGFSVQFPLLMREGRGQLKLNQLERRSTSYDQEMKGNDIRIKLLNANMQQSQLNRIAETQTQLVDQSLQLLAAEKTRFSTGESSIFLLNSREVALVNARLKALEINMRRQINVLDQWWIRGNMLEY